MCRHVAHKVTAITMRPVRTILLLMSLILTLPATPGRAFSDAELIDGFMRTVFGSEYGSWGWQSLTVKKFVEPVRLFVDDRSSTQRGAAVAAFARTLPALIDGLSLGIVSDPAAANFRVFVLDRADYVRVVSREVYGRADSTYAPGKCLVRIVSTRRGITRADAAIVADEGDALFRRCLVEEMLQGLGPANDDDTLSESVFNDRSPHTIFTRFDRHILNMLYHPRIRAGMSMDEARAVLPAVAAEVSARLR